MASIAFIAATAFGLGVVAGALVLAVGSAFLFSHFDPNPPSAYESKP